MQKIRDVILVVATIIVLIETENKTGEEKKTAVLEILSPFVPGWFPLNIAIDATVFLLNKLGIFKHE